MLLSHGPETRKEKRAYAGEKRLFRFIGFDFKGKNAPLRCAIAHPHAFSAGKHLPRRSCKHRNRRADNVVAFRPSTGMAPHIARLQDARLVQRCANLDHLRRLR